MSQLLPIVGPFGPGTDVPDSTRSIITIQKVKLKDQQLTCEFTEQRTQDAPPRAFALTCTEQVHPDLSHRLSRLVPHLCLLTEQLTETPDFWPDTAEELPASRHLPSPASRWGSTSPALPSSVSVPLPPAKCSI